MQETFGFPPLVSQTWRTLRCYGHCTGVFLTYSLCTIFPPGNEVKQGSVREYIDTNFIRTGVTMNICLSTPSCESKHRLMSKTCLEEPVTAETEAEYEESLSAHRLEWSFDSMAGWTTEIQEPCRSDWYRPGAMRGILFRAVWLKNDSGELGLSAPAFDGLSTRWSFDSRGHQVQ